MSDAMVFRKGLLQHPGDNYEWAAGSPYPAFNPPLRPGEHVDIIEGTGRKIYRVHQDGQLPDCASDPSREKR